jgi:hypothetical protein
VDVSDHGGACGHRFLVGGVIMAYIAPSLASVAGGNLWFRSPE